MQGTGKPPGGSEERRCGSNCASNKKSPVLFSTGLFFVRSPKLLPPEPRLQGVSESADRRPAGAGQRREGWVYWKIVISIVPSRVTETTLVSEAF